MSDVIRHVPFEGSPERQHFEFLRHGEFRLQNCTDCEQAIFYPRNLCPRCGSIALEWRKSNGCGEVYAVTVVRQAAAAGGDYNVALIDLEDGVRLMSRVVGTANDDIRIGLKVTADILPAEEGDPLLVFRAQEIEND